MSNNVVMLNALSSSSLMYLPELYDLSLLGALHATNLDTF